ncbi:MAG: sigma-70 family RNA polymerase sigma factor [Pseudomonadota bacterium]|nr:sigma-70 family RNA polymerase sigma factor [Pseudomonadota bacterium]
MEASELAEEAMWQRYRHSHDPAARDWLYLLHVPWATGIARSIHHRVRSYPADRDDFVQNATMGLLEAIARFDPGRGIAFRLYARPRVRGAVFNGLRAILGERTRLRDDGRFAARLEQMQEAGEGSAFDHLVDTIVGLGVGYLLDEGAQAACAGTGDALAYAQTAEIQNRLLKTVTALPERLRAIIREHYFQYVPFKDIAAKMGVSKGRVSQLHGEALSRLRTGLRDSR